LLLPDPIRATRAVPSAPRAQSQIVRLEYRRGMRAAAIVATAAKNSSSRDPHMSSTFIVTGQAGPKRLLATALSTAMLSTAASALAEANTATTADDAAASADIDSHKPNELEGVIVEGHAINEPASPKFTASLLDTPRAVTVLPATLIDDIGVVDLVDALRLIPGITFGAGEGGNPQGDRPYLRGYDAQGSVFVDGVRDVGAQSRETFDIQQIEVVKGPDSVYSGRSNGGGSINLVSKSPVADNFTQLGLGISAAPA